MHRLGIAAFALIFAGSGCYSSWESKYPDGGEPDATMPSSDSGGGNADATCALNNCYAIINARVGLQRVNGMGCCFEAQCTPAMPSRRAWVISCEDGTVHAQEYFP